MDEIAFRRLLGVEKHFGLPRIKLSLSEVRFGAGEAGLRLGQGTFVGRWIDFGQDGSFFYPRIKIRLQFQDESTYLTTDRNLAKRRDRAIGADALNEVGSDHHIVADFKRWIFGFAAAPQAGGEANRDRDGDGGGAGWRSVLPAGENSKRVQEKKRVEEQKRTEKRRTSLRNGPRPEDRQKSGQAINGTRSKGQISKGQLRFNRVGNFEFRRADVFDLGRCNGIHGLRTAVRGTHFGFNFQNGLGDLTVRELHLNPTFGV